TTLSPAPLLKAKVIAIKVVALTAISLALGFTYNYASTRYYEPDYAAGFRTGLLEGAVMPAALPILMAGRDAPIYAANNVGRGYKIGFILGLNTSGTIFFGVAFWQPRRRKKS
ncbi:MAG TPA: hypothetical protein VL970_01815, partial [Candidatus Acidoferrales bacterium]|nr:hypothetical protein [Candidatus Acidoferrales bacterium]